ncbi:hypothetical protein [Anabaena lutea]|uniref:Uncharacterized protein n=1 Tax=Anabaena lutea FACHB-196 TaxID=2692881 RepID=A0ABR8FLQ4_9NOST|nr:hypothetical protein [Anabaena lutea]MBD2570503.1 hypothetical protein [Anabaena lutea FACHB-196]
MLLINLKTAKEIGWKKCINAKIFINTKVKINKKINQLSYSELLCVLNHHQKYTDFNTLGLFRSILENEKLDIEQKIEVRDLAKEKFGNFYNFLQVKDPHTFFNLQTIGQDLTAGDIQALWHKIFENQSQILKYKRIKHRNFGIYSKHECGDKNCYLKGLMLKQHSWFKEVEIRSKEQKSHFYKKQKAILLEKKKYKHKSNLLDQ